VVVFEVPGFGFSMPQFGFRFDFLDANDVAVEFLRRLDLGPYVLAFPCVSAYAAIDIANRATELVSGVVILQAPSWEEEVKWKHGRDRQGILSKPIVGQLALQSTARLDLDTGVATAASGDGIILDFPPRQCAWSQP
jgi:hypothetical protein